MGRGRARVKSTGSASSSSAGLDRSQVVANTGDFDRMYPYVGTLKEMMRHAMILTGNDRTELIFSVLRRLEHYMGSEVTKLKRRPNRATRYARGIKKLTAMTKLVMAFLPDEAEAYPTLGLILVHYLDIVLDSSWKGRQSTKIIAATAYAFVKYMFDDDMEYVLDVVLTSIADKVAAEKDSIGYYIFVGIVRDIYFYCDKSSTLAKYCAIASLLSSLKRDSGNAAVKSAVGSCVQIPVELQKYLQDHYGFPKTPSLQFGLSTAIEHIDCRKVANMSRRRLVIVGGSKANKTRKSGMIGGTSSSSLSSCRNEEVNEESNCFFFDSLGSPSDVPASVPIDFSSLRGACVADEERHGFFLDNYPNLEVVSGHENNSGQFPHSRFNYDDNADDPEDSDNENNQNKDTEVEDGGSNGKKNDKSDTENLANKLLPFEDMFHRRNLLSRTNSSSVEPVKSITPPATYAKPVEDSDIEMIMEDVQNQGERDDVDSLDLGEEKDEADPESGESDVPVYNKSHIHQGTAASEYSDNSDEDEAKVNTIFQQNCSKMRIEDAKSETQTDAALTQKSVQVTQVDSIDDINSLKNGKSSGRGRGRGIEVTSTSRVTRSRAAKTRKSASPVTRSRSVKTRRTSRI